MQCVIKCTFHSSLPPNPSCRQDCWGVPLLPGDPCSVPCYKYLKIMKLKTKDNQSQIANQVLSQLIKVKFPYFVFIFFYKSGALLIISCLVLPDLNRSYSNKLSKFQYA